MEQIAGGARILFFALIEFIFETAAVRVYAANVAPRLY